MNLPVPVVIFWSFLSLVAYTYVGYPLLMYMLARSFGRPTRRAAQSTCTFSVVIAAHNEEQCIVRRIEEFLDVIQPHEGKAEIVVVSDGSADRTAALAASVADSRVQVVSLPVNVGKAEALNRGVDCAKGEVIVLADARQTWHIQALDALLANFTDSAVGAAGGQLQLADANGVVGSVGTYWKLEKWLRKSESRFHSSIGLSGSIAAVRRKLLTPLPQGLILDDVYWPLCVVMAGSRVVYDDTAIAFDRLPGRGEDEFRRKVRTLAGNFQLFQLLPGCLLPWKNPLWLQTWSHKVLRLAAPWLLIGAFVGSLLSIGSPLYAAAVVAQIACWGTGAAAIYFPAVARFRLFALFGTFVLLNAAATVALWKWLSGNAHQTWTKSAYTSEAHRGSDSK
jgi:cellulose synthase/poly-beta-1,6-N-acetylglucosamine synthase-like glycosyltransferase